MLHALEEMPQPPGYDTNALTAAHESSMSGEELRKMFNSLGIQYGPAFSGLVAVHTARGDVTTVLAEVALPGAIRSQQSAYASHPALLDACFQSVLVHPEVQKATVGGLMLPVGVRRLRNYHRRAARTTASPGSRHRREPANAKPISTCSTRPERYF